MLNKTPIEFSDSINFKDWLKVADEDFNFASVNLSEKRNSYYSQICFFFQQAAEKYLKAYIVAKKLEFRKIHELPTLLQICQGGDSDFKELRTECDYLTEFYFETRYPASLPASTLNQKIAEKAQKAAKRIGDFVKEKLI